MFFIPSFQKPILLLCLVLGIGMQGLSQTSTGTDSTSVYILNSDYPIQSLEDHTYIFLTDRDEDLLLEDVLEEESKSLFRPLSEMLDSLEGAKSAWLRVRINPKQTIENWWLVLHKGEASYQYWRTHYQTRCFFVENGKVVRQSASGVYVPASQKEIPLPNTTNIVYAQFTAGQVQDIYVHIQNRGETQIYPYLQLRDPAFKLPPPSGPGVNLYSVIQFSFILGIYVLFFFLYTKDYSYLYLFGVFACLWLHYHILTAHTPVIDWFFPEHPELVKVAWILTTTGTFLCFAQFGRTFSDLRKKSRKLDNYLLIVLGIITLNGLFQLAMLRFHPELSTIPRSIATFITFLSFLAAVIRMAFVKDTLVRYFVVAAIWFIFFAMLGILWNLGFLPFRIFDIVNPWAISQAGFMVINALAIAIKIQISERAKSEVQRVKEVDSIKSKFFANISHEFRTPLSLILGPINQSLEAIPSSENLEDQTEVPVKGKYLKVMKRNTLRLQNLVNQILDLSKLDQGKMQLKIAKGDLIAFLRSLVYSFESLAERKQIHFNTHFPAPIPDTYFDPDKVEKILVNLLSNAFKFTPEHGKITVFVEHNQSLVKISVSDSGTGMSKTDVQKIFDRFYQVEESADQGTGIGLSLVKELVDRYGGQISVESQTGLGTTFKVSLPFRRPDFNSADIISIEDLEEERLSDLWFQKEGSEKVQVASTKEDVPLVLVVEDNQDLRQYIADQIGKGFNVLIAEDGAMGLKLAKENLPDLIVSDVMMPKMNGLELCQAIKSDVLTSHIPVILLTAKAGQEAKLEGLQIGADDYLTKPFDGRELLVRTQNLIEQRQILRTKFAGELSIRPAEVSVSSMDERFLRDVMQQIETNIGNEYFTVEELARGVGFSRSQLARKIKALTGKTSNQLIREFRLTRAKELLEQQAGTVSEIAFQVGYSNLSYFSKSYKDTFGVAPSKAS